jgi:hypothetical protein
VFSTTSQLRFSVRSGSFFGGDNLLSVTSPLRFSKKVFFFCFWASKSRALAAGQDRNKTTTLGHCLSSKIVAGLFLGIGVRELAPVLVCGSASYRRGIREGGGRPPHSKACGNSVTYITACCS